MMSLTAFVMTLLLLICKESSVSAYKVILNKIKYQFVVTAGASMLLLNPAVSSAVVNCNKNCEVNCNKVAPGSADYCRTSCTEYCEQTDRYLHHFFCNHRSRYSSSLFLNLMVL
jgi:hypothetical protein